MTSTSMAVAVSSPALIRLITEIDDHGPLSTTLLGRTFPDLTRRDVLQARDTALHLGLITTGHGTYELTGHGADLAEAYDQAARWARRHGLPARNASFISRVQTAVDHATLPDRHDETHASAPAAVRDALTRWTTAVPDEAEAGPGMRP
ncbi:hypothetical protein ABZ714_28605 [Streptomyces sp. NPDC006798]|uniref:hypothetical protein n=1 Tax=Streptomyces sp. NPDC006798 TaxID=3155462 RepID=UPI0034000870